MFGELSRGENGNKTRLGCLVRGRDRDQSGHSLQQELVISLAFYCLKFNKKSDLSVRQVSLSVIAIRERGERRGKQDNEWLVLSLTGPCNCYYEIKISSLWPSYNNTIILNSHKYHDFNVNEVRRDDYSHY